MVAAVIVGSNPLNFSVAIIALCLPVQSHFSLAAQLTQISVTFQRLIPLGAYRRRSIWTLSSNIAIEPERSLARTNHFLAPVFTHACRRVPPAGIYIIENKDKTRDNLSFIAHRPLFRLDHVFYQAATNFGAHSYQFKAFNFLLDNLGNNERIAFNRP
jgi:hypothetical protein